MKNKSFILCLLAIMTTACLMSSCKGKDSNEPYVGYLFAYFNGNAPWQEQICFALSADGYNYTPLNDGKPIISSDTIANKRAVRDPHILRGEDGYFYMVITDMRSSQGWSSNDGLVLMRSKDLVNWERLPDMESSSQQRNVVLHPEFVDGKYALYTRPQDGFIDAGSGGGIGWALVDSMEKVVITEEKIINHRFYHTIKECKNGEGPHPIKTDRGWIHIAHGVRNTAAGLRYVIYAFATDLNDPSKVIAEPSGMLIGPRGGERVGDVSNVVFTNGAIVNENNEVFLYYASSDTRMHVATTTIEKLLDYVFETPKDPGRSVECVAQRCELIQKNLEFLKSQQ